MIESGEVHSIANEQNVQATQIEKDYVISWVLFGIANNAFLHERLAFKGGTVLRKVYFPEYRLSEDLDFTWRGDGFGLSAIVAAFEEVNAWVREEANIPLRIQGEHVYDTGNASLLLHYVGPLGGSDNNKSIKVDISPAEHICNEPAMQPIDLLYSDLEDDYAILCYLLEEVIPEKMRSLMQRTEVRDLYDLWYLFEEDGRDIRDYVSCFQAKTKYKQLDPANLVEIVQGKRDRFEVQWVERLSRQMNDVPHFEEVWRKMGRHFREFDEYIGN